MVKIINNKIVSNVMVNGALTSQIPIRRSIWQGYPLSMFLYAIALEPFIYNINNNHHINPNFR